VACSIIRLPFSWEKSGGKLVRTSWEGKKIKGNSRFFFHCGDEGSEKSQLTFPIGALQGETKKVREIGGYS